MQGAGADQTKAQLREMILILEALSDGKKSAELLFWWRLESKVAHAALLSRATLNPDREDARWERADGKRITSASTYE